MYWIGLICLIIIVVFFLVGVTVTWDDDPFPLILGTILFVALICLYVNWATYTIKPNSDIPPKEISIMSDKDVVIVRYNDVFQETFKSKKEYDSVIDSSFVLKESVEYNIRGEEIGKIYKLIVK